MGIAYNFLNDRLYICDSDNCHIVILKRDLTYNYCFGRNGNEQGQLQYPCSIAFDHCGQIYVTEFSNDRIQVFSSSKQYLNMIQDTGNGGKLNPYGIGFDSGDTMYVSEVGNHFIRVFDKFQRFACFCGSKGSSEGQLRSPNAVHIDSNDSILVADTDN